MLAIGEDEVARLRAPEIAFMNVNTPDELARAEAIVGGAGGEVMDARVDGLGISSIPEINALPPTVAEALYARLIPAVLFERFNVDPVTLCDGAGTRLVRITAPADKPWARVELRASPDDRDPALLVDIEMSPLAVPELAFVQIADPARPRYAIDRDFSGRDTLLGTTARNVDEEVRAMNDGLAPGQVRPGLRLLPRVLEAMESFCGLIGQELFLIEPLFYHSAILYERRGCGYLFGREVMEEIHAEFGDGGRVPRRPRRLLAVPPARAPRSPRAAGAGRSTTEWAALPGAASRCTRPPACTPASTPSPAVDTSRAHPLPVGERAG